MSLELFKSSIFKVETTEVYSKNLLTLKNFTPKKLLVLELTC